MALVIRQAGFGDLEDAARMEVRAWREAYQGLLGPSIFEDMASDAHGIAAHWSELMQMGHYFWIVVDDDQVVGVCHAGPARDDEAPEPLELDTLYLLEQAQGTGVASSLLNRAIGDAPAYLWVLRGNDRAIAFYEKEGFQPDGASRENESMAGATELRMVRRAQA